ncbi:hypothetical protein HP062_09335 [Pseudomonas sp. B14-6]|jgi:hypothetical protein|uniref:hypothetical protein n=1 Tax=Pseudomonas sp. B14-6 TaxID=2738843 RepID=UPI00155EC8FE|nr:hypothetical protein [Pseudomonas sp. B14-6]QKG65768.1 hypothetical protein HP062_09335 [Pseudomonas sp. B14-6]
MIDLKQDAASITHINQRFDDLVGRNREELLSRIKDEPQRVIIQYYLNVLRELCKQGCGCLPINAFSTLEALSRVIMEQSANMLYVGMDSGDNARSLLRSSKKLTESNGKSWAAYLSEQGLQNPAAQARQANGERMLADFDRRWPDVERYPGGKGLFAALGWENNYYAFYAPLCDSVHSFSDDLSNLVSISEVFAESAGVGEQLLMYWEKERRRLATYHYTVAIALRGEAFGRVCSAVDLILDDKEAEGIYADLHSLIDRHEDFDGIRLSEMNAGDLSFENFPIN